jgi:hypothetical protein
MHALMTVVAALAAAQAPPPIEQGKIDMAIRKGVEYLKGQAPGLPKPNDKNNRTERELVLWTMVHADVPETDPVFHELFKDMMERQLEATYCVALQAMILEELNRVKYQARIRQCAQFLVDNQCANGQWSYGTPTLFANETPSDAGRSDVASAGGEKKAGVREFSMGRGPKPEVKNKVKVEKKRDGPGSGDNSNTQYAALGMRACFDAGVIIPEAVVEKAMSWYRTCQKSSDGAAMKLDIKDSLDKITAAPGQSGVMEAIVAEPQGWCYGQHDHKAYGSMTAGSVGGLAIWDYIKDNDGGKKKRSWRKDKDVHEGIAWLASKFSVTYNPGPYEHGNGEENSQHQYLYYLYALERAGMLYGTETLGSHWWYPEGAKVLVASQGAGGAWGGTVDTCFAILFLKRATAPLCPTGDMRNK